MDGELVLSLLFYHLILIDKLLVCSLGAYDLLLYMDDKYINCIITSYVLVFQLK